VKVKVLTVHLYIAVFVFRETNHSLPSFAIDSFGRSIGVNLQIVLDRSVQDFGSNVPL
jgi:hypothetical protein